MLDTRVRRVTRLTVSGGVMLLMQLLRADQVIE